MADRCPRDRWDAIAVHVRGVRSSDREKKIVTARRSAEKMTGGGRRRATDTRCGNRFINSVTPRIADRASEIVQDSNNLYPRWGFRRTGVPPARLDTALQLLLGSVSLVFGFPTPTARGLSIFSREKTGWT